jgi:hypothetical protein
MIASPVEGNLQTRDLLRMLRRPPTGAPDQDEDPGMPESYLWTVYMELRRRGEPQATQYFLSSLKSLHRRRTLGAAELSFADPNPAEHRLAEDPFLAELWRAYKKCIQNNRTGPAAQLLRDIEAQLSD